MLKLKKYILKCILPLLSFLESHFIWFIFSFLSALFFLMYFFLCGNHHANSAEEITNSKMIDMVNC